MTSIESSRKRARLMPLLALALGLGGLALLLVYAKPNRIAGALSSFDTRLVPLLLALAIVDYAVRFWRWRLLVRLVAGSTPPLLPDLACYLAANTLMLTPARAGDWSRSAYARSLFGTPATMTAPVPLMERIVDVVLMASFAGIGTLVLGASPLFAVTGFLVAFLVLVLVCGSRVNAFTVHLIRRMADESFANQAELFFQHMRSLWRPLPISVAFGLGAAAWLLECAAFFVVLCGLHFEPSLRLAGQATFIYPVSNLAGSLSLLPGGLGVAEGSAAGLTTAFVGASASTALAAGLLIRAVIVGFGVVSGLPGLLYVSLRLSRAREAGAAANELVAA